MSLKADIARATERVADEDEGRVLLGAGQRYEQGQPSHHLSAAGRWGMVVVGVVRCPVSCVRGVLGCVRAGISK